MSSMLKRHLTPSTHATASDLFNIPIVWFNCVISQTLYLSSSCIRWWSSFCERFFQERNMTCSFIKGCRVRIMFTLVSKGLVWYLQAKAVELYKHVCRWRLSCVLHFTYLAGVASITCSDWLGVVLSARPLLSYPRSWHPVAVCWYYSLLFSVWPEGLPDTTDTFGMLICVTNKGWD